MGSETDSESEAPVTRNSVTPMFNLKVPQALPLAPLAEVPTTRQAVIVTVTLTIMSPRATASGTGRPDSEARASLGLKTTRRVPLRDSKPDQGIL